MLTGRSWNWKTKWLWVVCGLPWPCYCFLRERRHLSTRSRHCLWSNPRNGQSIIWVFFHSHFLLTLGDSKGYFTFSVFSKNKNMVTVPLGDVWSDLISEQDKYSEQFGGSGGSGFQTNLILCTQSQEESHSNSEAFYFQFDIGPHRGWWVTGALSPVLEAHVSLFKHQSLWYWLPWNETLQEWSCPVLLEEGSQTRWELEWSPGYQYK